MYLHTMTKNEPAYVGRWHEMFGSVSVRAGLIPRTYDVFECDTCGETVNCLRLDKAEAPAEPFYCGECNGLISVSQPSERGNMN